MDLHRIGIKVPMCEGADVPALEFIRTFHRWIQEKALPGTLLDVADYSHVHEGPGVLLITHEGNYAVDDSGGRRGLAYYSKHSLSGDLSARIKSVIEHALRACDLLEREPALRERVRFDAGQLEIFSNDRLAAPNTAATGAALLPVITGILDRLYARSTYEVVREPDPRERFALRIRADGPAPVGALLSVLDGAHRT